MSVLEVALARATLLLYLVSPIFQAVLQTAFVRVG